MFLYTLNQWLIAFQSYGYNDEPSLVAMICSNLFALAIVVVMIAAMWRVFEKAGQPGWASIVPIYNTIVMLEIAGKETWWFLLMLIPGVNIVIIILTYQGISENFGLGAGFTIGLIILPFVFWPILGFNKDIQYQGGKRKNAF